MVSPKLLFDEAGIVSLRSRIATQDWARSYWEKLKGDLDGLLKKEVVLPPRGGNWFHWHASPTTGASLEVGKQIGDWAWEHIDPVSGEIFTGDPSEPSRDYDGCVIRIIHYDWCDAIRNLGVAYQITEDRTYAQKAREIVLAYADKYLAYPLHNTRGEEKIGGGRVGPQTLNEAVWTISVCQGVDLIWDILSDTDRKNIADHMLQPAARDVILPHEMKVHNIQCWKNSAVGLVGFLLDDDELVEQAIEHPVRGYYKQMAEGVTPDGQWWEGAWGYHFYTMEAVWPLVEAARHCGVDLYGDALRRMFDGPVTFATPSRKLPAFNDSHEVDLVGRGDLYELGYARYHNAEYVRVLSQSNRQNNMALWFGEPDLPDVAPRKWRSVNYPNSGYAILSKGEGEAATWLCFKYGPHGGGHGHPDKLNFVLATQGQMIGVDPGTCKYGLPVRSGWYKTSFSHNVLIVDETEQTPTEGVFRAFVTVDDVPCCIAEAGDIYEGVRHIRLMALVDENTILIADRVVCAEPRVLDIAYHQRGVWADVPKGESWTPPDKDGYRYVKEATTRTVQGISLLLDVGDDARASVVLADGEDTEVMTGTGFGDHTEDHVPVVVFRRKAQETLFVWGISLNGETLNLRTEMEVGRQWVWVNDRRFTFELGDDAYGFGG